MPEVPETSVIYRSLHASPMVGGLPVYWCCGLVIGGLAGTVAVMAVATKLAGLAVILAVAVAWGLLAYVYAQDRVRLPLLLIRRKAKVSAHITSYAPSRRRCVIEEK
jgi:hypothetical protein